MAHMTGTSILGIESRIRNLLSVLRMDFLITRIFQQIKVMINRFETCVMHTRAS